jgi:hypothetical protein
MVGYEPRKRPGLTFLGFFVSLVLFVLVKVAYDHEWFAGLGWRGGEYAYLFIGVVLATPVVGLLVRAVLDRSSWRSLGTGMVIGGTIGLVILLLVVVVFTVGMSRARIPF